MSLSCGMGILVNTKDAASEGASVVGEIAAHPPSSFSVLRWERDSCIIPSVPPNAHTHTRESTFSQLMDEVAK